MVSFDLDVWCWLLAAQWNLVPREQLVAWADAQIIKCPQPPRWLLEMSLLQTPESFAAVWSQLPNDMLALVDRGVETKQVELGLVYLRYVLENQIGTYDFLMEALQYGITMRGVSNITSDSFQALQNEACESAADDHRDSLQARIQQLFLPLAKKAQNILYKLPAAMSVRYPR